MGPDGAPGWQRTLYASVAAQFLCMIGFSFGLPFLPFFLHKDLGVTDPAELRKWTGIVAASAAITLAIFSPIWGAVADRYGRKIMVMRSMFGAGLIMVLMSLARTPEHLVALRLAQGTLTGTITANMVLVASIVPKERSGYALGLVLAAAHAGNAIGPAIGGVIADHIGFRLSFIVGAVFLLAAGSLIKFGTVEKRPDAGPREPFRFSSYGEIFALAGFAVVLVAMFLTTFSQALATPLFPLFVAALRNTAEGAASITGLLLSIGAAAGVIATGVAGKLADRWGHKRMLMLCAGSAAVVLFLIGLAQNLWHLAVLKALLGVATAGIQPSAGALLRSIVPERHIGKSFGIMQSVRATGMALGPLAGGYIAAQFDGIAGFRVPYMVTGALLLAVPAVLYYGAKLKGTPAPERSA
jgi:DHA1 family multidrug resistance protein-like MFS transporter